MILLMPGVVCGGAGGPAHTYATWNPADKQADITLSNANLTAAIGVTANAMVRANQGKSAGKWYWEVTMGLDNFASSYIGATVAGAALTSNINSSASGYSYNEGNGWKGNNGGNVAYGAAYVQNDVVGIALDMDAGTIEFFKNGVSQGVAFTGIAGTLFPAFSSGGDGAATANFGATGFAYAVPGGFNAGVYL